MFLVHLAVVCPVVLLEPLLEKEETETETEKKKKKGKERKRGFNGSFLPETAQKMIFFFLKLPQEIVKQLRPTKSRQLRASCSTHSF